MGAQHPAGRGTPLFHHLPDDEAGVTAGPKLKREINPMHSRKPCRCGRGRAPQLFDTSAETAAPRNRRGVGGLPF